MDGGSVTKTRDSSGAGSVHVNGNFTMTGGSITGNQSACGGGVFVDVNGTFNLSGDAVISGNGSSYAGAGVYLKMPANEDPEYIGGTFNMTGGTITGNELYSYHYGFASLGDGDGGGVWVGDTCTFNMTGGTITGNSSTYMIYADDPEYNDRDTHMGLGGGVYVRPQGIFNISGAPVIKGNTIGNKPESLVPKTENNVFLEDYGRINIVGELTGAEVGVSPDYQTTRPSQMTEQFVEQQMVTTGYSEKAGGMPPFAASFFCDVPGYAATTQEDSFTSKNEVVIWKHTHDFVYTVNDAGDTLNVGCADGNCDYNAAISINAADAEFTGEAVAAELSDPRLFNMLTGADAKAADVEYYQGSEKLASAPSAIGAYTAKYTFDAYTIAKDYSITAPVHEHTWSFTGFTWTGNTAAANYACTFTGCGETASAAAAVDPAALPEARCVDDQTVTLTASVAAADSPDGQDHAGTADNNGVQSVTVTAIGSHDFDESIDGNMTVVPATCLVDGSKTVKCSRCDETQVTELAAPGSHDFDESIEGNVTIVPATCLENGSKTVKCSRCDATQETVLAAPGHDWSEWTVVTPATETEKGLERRECSRCDAVEEREIPATGEEEPAPDHGIKCCCLERLISFFRKLVNLFKKMFAGNSIC